MKYYIFIYLCNVYIYLNMCFIELFTCLKGRDTERERKTVTPAACPLSKWPQ